MEKRLRSSLQSSAEEFLKSATKLGLKSTKPSLKSLIYSLTTTSPTLSNLTSSLHRSISQSISKFKTLSNPNDAVFANSPQTPPSKRLRRSSRHRQSTATASTSNDENREVTKRSLLESLQIYAYVVHLCVTHPRNVFLPEDLLPVARELHDNLVLFESDSALLTEIASLCEEWWKADLVGKETLITQSLPFLLSKSLTCKRKVDIHRVYALRDAFTLFDFEDESIEDLKHLLIRCLISPLYLKTEDGRKFIAFMFGLSGQLLKEALAMIKSQIPFGRKSMLEAYGEIVFRAWKAVEGEAKEEIETGFLQGLIESAIHARTGAFAACIRRVVGGFINQRTVDGVEKLLFRLAEPVIFRSLQVANSNVRQNALHLLLDLFPLEDPEATKEVKDTLLDKQFFLLDKLLMDECPDVRVVAVEGACRILNMFWEVLPSQFITKIITKIFDQMTHDTCTEVRLSTVNGIIYLLENPLSHEVLKVLLPRLGHLIQDATLSIRAAVLDLLLCLKNIRNFQFHKVVPLDLLLPKLANDQPLVARRITKLLIPSYFPMTVTHEEACKRCVTLIKRSPFAGARLCEFALSEGASLGSLMQLFKVLLNLVLSPGELEEQQIDGLLISASRLCRNLVNDTNYKVDLQEDLSAKKLKRLFAAAATARAQSSVCDIVSAISPQNIHGLFEECMSLIVNCTDLTGNIERQDEVRSAHKMVISCNWFDDMLEALSGILEKTVSACNVILGIESAQCEASTTRKRSKSSSRISSKLKHVNAKRSSSKPQKFNEDYAVAVGIAWQIKDLLLSENTREAILVSRYLGNVFYALKVISEVSILRCMHYEGMSAAPVSAYTALSLHMSLHNVKINGIKSPDIRTKCFPNSARSYPEKNVLDLTVDHLFSCATKLFRDNSSGISGVLATKQNRISNLMKLLTAILKFIVDCTTTDLISHGQERSLNFIMEYIKFVIFNLKKFSGDRMQFTEECLTEIRLCLKSSFTYAAKYLNVVLLHSSEASALLPGCYNLPNQLLDLIVTIEECLGYKYAARLVAAIKQWVPDIILALGCQHILNPAATRESVVFDHVISSCPLWLSILAKSELFHLRDVDSDEESGTVSQGQGLIAFEKLIEMMVQQLTANYNVLDAVGLVFLSVSRLGLDRNDFDLLLGLLHFVCAKMIRCDDQQLGELKLMLASVHEIYQQLEIEAEKPNKSEDQRRKLYRARDLLKPVWMYYFCDEGTDQMEEI